MATLVESLSRWVGRVELVARGFEGQRKAAEAALGRDRPLEAREAARAIVSEIPDSIAGLALWADAAEAAWLDEEAVEALTALAALVPFRAEVWLRLGLARARLGAEAEARAALEQAASLRADDADGRRARRRALFEMCDRDLAAGDVARAERWLGRASADLAGAAEPGLGLRRAECALARGDLGAARHAMAEVLETTGEEGASPDRLPGRRALVRARLAWAEAAPEDVMAVADARALAVRAFLLDAPGADVLLAQIAGATRDAPALAAVREIVVSEGQGDQPWFAAAFAVAEGRHDDAREALGRALGQGDERAAHALVALAVERRDEAALERVAREHARGVPAALEGLVAALAAERAGDVPAALDALDRVGGQAEAWADALRVRVLEPWVRGERAQWSDVFGALLAEARAQGRLELVARVEGLSRELERPLVLAIVGEFNAGKSTFINALLGVDVAPTGVLPTTATVHHVAWAPDPFARVLVPGAPDRVVPHAALRGTLDELRAQGAIVARVLLYAPIERLRRVEVIDTPGFNAPDAAHAARAREAFEEAHAVVWLLDASATMKASEVAVLRELVELGLPLLVLVNKLDRLRDGEEARAREHVSSALAEAAVPVHAGPLFLSAKRALAGRLGDDAALAASRWSDVEALLGEVVVDRADVLRERGVRRRAARLALELAEGARAREAASQAEAEGARAAREGLARAAAWIFGDEAARTEELLARLAPTRDALVADLRPLGAAHADDELRAYAVARLVVRVGPELGRFVAQGATVDVPPRALAAAQAALEGAAWMLDDPQSIAAASFPRLVGVGLRALGRALGSEAEHVAARPPGSAAGARLAALAGALSRT